VASYEGGSTPADQEVPADGGSHDARRGRQAHSTPPAEPQEQDGPGRGASGVQVGSRNIQVNYFYGGPTSADGGGTPRTPSEAEDPFDQGHAFISYVREDLAEVSWLENLLTAAGIRVWRDMADLLPGEDWRAKIRDAITRDALVFIACFSSRSAARRKSYMNEELLLAVEQLRLRQPHDPWLIPVRFDDCRIPNLELGPGRTLNSIQWVNLYGASRDEAGARLVAAVQRLLREPRLRSPEGPTRAPLLGVPAADPSSGATARTGSQAKRHSGLRLPVRPTRRAGAVAGGIVVVTAALVAALMHFPGPSSSAPPTGIALSATLANKDRYQIQGSIAFSPDGKTIFGAGVNSALTTGHIYQWKVTPGNQLVTGLTAPRADVQESGLVIDATGKILVIGDRNGIGLWDLSTPPPRFSTMADPDKASSEALAYSQVGDTLAEGNADGNIHLMDLSTRKWGVRIVDPADAPPPNGTASSSANFSDIVISGPGKTLAASDTFGNVYVWNVSGGSPIMIFGGAATTSSDAVAFSPDGNMLAVSGYGTELWRVGTRNSSVFLRGPDTQPEAEAFNQNGSILATGDSNGTIYLWDVAKREVIGHIATGITTWGWLTFSPDGKTLAAARADKIYLYSINYPES
jgi:hypothetical protein